MEAFALFYIAKMLNKKASCLMSVVDLRYSPDVQATSEERETGLNNMITLALESAIKISVGISRKPLSYRWYCGCFMPR